MKTSKLTGSLYSRHKLRLVAVALGILVLAVLTVLRTAQIKFWSRDFWLEKNRRNGVYNEELIAARGSILSDEREVLAVTMPFFEIGLDVTMMKEENYPNLTDSVQALCSQLAAIFEPTDAQYTEAYFKNKIARAKLENDRHIYLLEANRYFTYSELKKVKACAILNQGQYAGGLIVVPLNNKRFYPFKDLAKATIGTIANNTDKPVRGIEYAYNSVLKGKNGVITKQRVGKERAIPVSWQSGVDPRDGYDLVTTLNVNMQDVVATALARACEHHKAKTGVAILMEVETGAIKAMANYSETFNHAVQSLVEPGSTFKLASIMAALEDGVIRPTDSVTTHGGLLRFHDYDMRDEANYGTLSVQKAVEKSSNVAIAKLINQNYQDRPRRFVDLLERIGAIRTTGIDLKGEPEPILTRPGSTTWSRVSLPWLATGYGVQLTPLQVLAFYNAIANNGAYTQPYIVQRIKGNSADQRTYEPRILQDRICSEKTLAAVRAMLEGVVEHGTARNIYKPDFRIAGKTGTAKIAVDGQYQKIYRSSFVGYFPADAPRYSCIVMIDQPQGGEIYGATVAAPVVREIADHVHAHLTTSRLRTLPPADPDKRVSLPITEAVYHEDVRTVYNKLNISAPNHPDSRYVRSKQKGEIVELSPLPVYAGRVPNVRGMSAKDALALLENMGLKVRLRGHGKVKYQSLGAGSRFRSNDLIELTLH